MERKLLRICITFILLCIGINVKAEIANGTCGDNLTWVLNEDGTLTISGSGEMDNWSSNDAPWYSNRSKIHKVVIDNSVTSIGDSAFWYCYGLTSVTIPNSVTSIGNNAFNGSLREVNVSCENENDFISYLQRMDRYDIFYYRINASLRLHNIIINGEKKTSIIIPNSVTSIEADAFLNCASLTSIIIPNSVTTIGVNAFSGCSGLTSVNIPNSVTSIGDYAFGGCSGLTSANIPNSVISIGSNSFVGCSGLTSVNIPNSVKSIGERSFEGCSKVSFVVIGENVEEIGGRCFFDCLKIREITCKTKDAPTINATSFEIHTKNNAILKVPKGSEAMFKAAEGWKDFVYLGSNTTSDSDINHDGQINVGDLTELVNAIINGVMSKQE